MESADASTEFCILSLSAASTSVTVSLPVFGSLVEDFCVLFTFADISCGASSSNTSAG